MSLRAEPGTRPFAPDDLLARLQNRFPQPARYWVAFSGGLDSSVLLHALGGLRDRLGVPLAAVHVDHGLQPDSADWARGCQGVCERLAIPLTILEVHARPLHGESPEAAARAARYAALAGVVGRREMLLTAHHLDDQAETLLLQLLRGAGVEGLAAMPVVQAWHGGWHARPLLDWRRGQLRDWAQTQGLGWIDDPSNAGLHADRNYLRHQVMPLLRERWPAATNSIARSATLCGEAAEVLRAHAAAQLPAFQQHAGRSLEIASLCALPHAEARLLLREWLRRAGAPALPWRRLHEALEQLCHARTDAAPCISWAGWALRRYRGQAWLVHGGQVDPPTGRLAWEDGDLHPGPGLGVLRRRLAPGGIDRRHWQPGRVTVGFRGAGLQCRPAGRDGSRSFKKIAQEFAIPPWLRGQIPLVFIDGQLAAIANACVCEPFAAPDGEPGWVIDWLCD